MWPSSVPACFMILCATPHKSLVSKWMAQNQSYESLYIELAGILKWLKHLMVEMIKKYIYISNGWND